MGGGVFGRFRAVTGGSHPLPEADSRFRVVAGAGHVDEPDAVGFALHVAAEGEEHAELGARTEEGKDRAAGRGVEAPKGGGDSKKPDLRELFLEHALGAVLGDGVGNLVGHDDGEALFVLCDFEDAAVNGHLAAGEAPGVLRGGGDQRELPGETRVIGDFGDAFADPADEGGFGAGADDLGGRFGEDVAVGLGAERGLVFLGEGNALGAAGDGDGLFFGPAVEEEGEADEDGEEEADRGDLGIAAFLDGDGADLALHGGMVGGAGEMGVVLFGHGTDGRAQVASRRTVGGVLCALANTGTRAVRIGAER